ncbi:MAG: hypothetical protein A3A98_04205 [Candidatus Staskawiczbacteria bacterium RIFCSPLOWO2_01_FULL_40_39]|uniref:Glycosyltransferase 2-like domain-containing protein n=1 Tax=Candidatus Staskawiczbacteria bacterium RIFCSPHIGHO2_01_FULL_39_25 TaxID=1802202 RepID=A0A1G2HNP6_9BACT|nr:MAG: hypothetical protein A2730_03420 [Candidatus Staskawiczbacteria bacterium RIFCSPHIGHO2_01_FULL_39_25]OGZ73971.1 MAG: hypothetical protein A3A98_04205 [Candidatus Staskawiczbacteria bacterium RIFCSPLOWO2_01_FULL_40_39]OGZ75136.1 MAG: hypothetical protein A3I87_00440 [Candidatus Staskawiczbacteria bacterium RIFCSPLOWO2_02_FULL_39_8]
MTTAYSEKPIVSVIIATYNRAKTLPRAIDSALNQSYGNIEIMVIDDGSTDATEEVVRSYSKNPKVRYMYQENKNCHVDTRNNGIKATQGKYLAILDDDDFWCDVKKIEKQVDFLENNKEYVLVGGGAIKIDHEGNEIVRYLLPEKDADIREKILISNSFAHVTVLFKKEAWETLGGYDPHFDGMEDWNLWMRMGTIGKFHNIQEFFVRYTGHQRGNLGYVEKKYSKQEWLKLNIKLKKKFKGQYPHYAKALLFCWLGYFYSLLPFRRQLWPAIFKIRSALFKETPWKYKKK